MGWIHYLAYQKISGIKIAAIATRDPKKLKGDWRSIKGNFGPAGEKVDLKGIAAYPDVESMLADETLDLIDICLPPHMHREFTLKALKAGKHVFCEKPLAVNAKDCESMVKEAKKQKLQLLVGHVLPFFPEFEHIRKLVDSEKYGKLLGGNFKRVVSDPTWLTDFYDPEKVGGPMIDLHCHDAHYIRLLFGMPNKVVSQGRVKGEVAEYFNSLFYFDDPNLCVSATSGVINQQGRTFTHGVEVHFEKATVQFELAVLAGGEIETMPIKVLTSNGKVTRPKLKAGDDIAGFVSEIKEVMKSIKSGQTSPILAGDLARDAVKLCHKQTESIIKGKAIKV